MIQSIKGAMQLSESDDSQLRIAFTGKAGCGKTVRANYLCANYGFVRISFASKLKDFAAQILLTSIDHLNVKHRAFLQRLSGAREVDSEVWIK